MAYETDISVFHAVLDAGSFSGAARNLGMTHSAISKRVSALEARLGTQLLVRSTRQMQLTESGEIYANETRGILARLKAVETEISEKTGELKGRIRVTSSNALGKIHIVPALFAFMSKHPGVMIDLTLTDSVVDIIRDQMDLAVRSANLLDSSLVARRLITNRRIICASPDYLARKGTPTSPAELINHNCLRLNLQGAYNEWGLIREGDQKVRLGPGFACNSLEMLRTACQQAHGIGWLPMFLVAQDVEDETLVPLLDEFRDPGSDTSISIVRPNLDMVPKRTRALIDFLDVWFRNLDF